MKKLAGWCICCVISIVTHGQAPANDSCGAAISITPQSFSIACSGTTASTTVNATPSPNTPSCTGIANCDDDIWYQFTATTTSVVVKVSNATLVPSGTATVGIAVYEATCPTGSGNFICDPSAFIGNGHKIVAGLSVGSTYYLRFWSSSTTADMNFNFCVQAAAAPANDDCSNAVSLNINAFGTSCTNPVFVNTTGATQSANSPTSCTNFENNDDVWYSFTATSQSILIRVDNITNTITGSTGTTASFALYEGACPAGTASFACDNGFAFSNGWKIVNGLTIGSTYYLRMWIAGANNYGSFNLCVQETPAPPVNDECLGAVPVTINPFGTFCTTPVAVNTSGATQSANNPSSCTNLENNDDVWYSFTASSQSIIIRVSNIVNTLTGSTASTASYALYESSCPTTNASFSCDNGFAFSNGWKIISGLTVGTTYYLRIWMAGINNYGSMNLCVQEVPAAPVNDDCSNALPLTINPFGTSCTNTINVNTTGATQSANNPVACTGAENNDDLWYSFTATSQSIIIRSANIINTITGSTATSTSFALYEGACPASTTSFACDNGFAFGNGWKIVSGLTIGNTYYLRVWIAGINNYGSFTLCVQETPPPPANNECAGALPLTINAFGANCTNAVQVNTTGATMSALNPSPCTVSEHNDDLWFSFTASSQSVIVRVNNIINTITGSAATSTGMALYSAACPVSATTFVCDAGFAFSEGYKIIDGLTIGNTYYLRLWISGINNYGSFNLCVQEVPPPPVNNECANAISLAVAPPTASCLSPVIANTTGATQSAPAPSCTTISTNDDIWYSFTATTAIHKLQVNEALITTTGGIATIGYALYSGACPASTTTVSCSNGFALGNGSVSLTGLTPGNLYYLRLFTSGSNNYGSFKFCLLETPVNNECTGAVNLPVGYGFCTSPVVGTLNTATTSAGFGAPACNTGASSVDVWYKVQVPATGNLIIQTAAVNTSVTNLLLEAYTGTCGSLTYITCDDDGNPETTPSANHARITLSGRTPGEQLFLRVMPLNGAQAGDFVICSWDSTSSVLPPVAPGGTCISSPVIDISAVNQNRYFWVPLFDSAGRIIAEVYSDGSSLNTVAHSLNTNVGAVRQQAGKFYLDRNLSMYVNGTGTIKVRLYFRNTELAALQGVDSTVNAGNLQILRVPDSCSSLIINTPAVLTGTRATYGNDHYIQFSTNVITSFFVEGKCGSVITWLGSVDTNWHNPLNWDCGGVPWINSEVVIPGSKPRYPTLAQPAEIKKLTVQPGANATLAAGIILKINGQ